MLKLSVEFINLIAVFAIFILPFLKTKNRGLLILSAVTLQILISSILAISIFLKGSFECTYPGSWVTGLIPVRIDYLSAWFILIISFAFLTGAWYGIQYMKQYIDQESNLTLHAIVFILLYTSLIDICIIQNGFAFLILWEIMALSSFLAIIFEHYKAETLKAGINFLIQSHFSVVFIALGFMWIKIKAGSFDFNAISQYTLSQPALMGIGLFACFFIGFAIKSGFVPFHTWLPLAHPVAPSHISGIMSGVIIKIGIYGILRILMLVHTDMVTIGYFILFVSVITGVYGVMLAIVQHNLKKLLAYHSIENIGIIGMGIGLGCLGLGYNNQILVVTGFGGALLHTLNHSLFKSLLFYGAGNVYQATHIVELDRLGGLIKKIPQSAWLFLIGSLAICGLPPFNGFVSEFFIFNGLYKGLLSNQFIFTLVMLFSILGLVLIGGLALICFTKAFGIVFLGNPREKIENLRLDEKPPRMIPMYLVALFIVLIGLFPFFLSPFLLKTICVFQHNPDPMILMQYNSLVNNLTTVGRYSIGLVLLTLTVFFIRHLITNGRNNTNDITWGCGYTGDLKKIQYSASSYIRSYRKLIEPVLSYKNDKKSAMGIYPQTIKQKTHFNDKLEFWLIDQPLTLIRRLLNRFVFLQNGNIQSYILYGFIFIGLAVLVPILINKLYILLKFLTQL